MCYGQYTLPNETATHIMPKSKAIAIALLTMPLFEYRFFYICTNLFNFYIIMIMM